MGPVHARLTLSNPSRSDLAPISVDARLGADSSLLRLPERLAPALGLTVVDERIVALDDGAAGPAPYAGPLRMDLAGRIGLSGAIVVGDHVKLGSIAMDDMDLIVDPTTGEAAANPLRPDVAGTVAVGLRAPFKDN